jgi:hypothetical protein
MRSSKGELKGNDNMASKAKPKTAVKPDSPKLIVHTKKGEDLTAAYARASLRPSVQGALTVQAYTNIFGELNLAGLVEELTFLAKQVTDGDLTRIEGMLNVQAHTLDAIFNNLARRASKAEYMNQIEQYLRLALKAQSQCRSTLETLAEIKNPRPVAFVKQANISNGPQQVNNGNQVASLPPAHGKIENQQNKLLEGEHGTRMDFGKAGAASGANQALETVGKIDGAENIRG